MTLTIDFSEFKAQPPALLTVRELAAALGVSIDAVDRGISDGEIPAVRLRSAQSGRRYVPRSYLDRIDAIGRGEASP